jgi:hypothetical protein
MDNALLNDRLMELAIVDEWAIGEFVIRFENCRSPDRIIDREIGNHQTVAKSVDQAIDNLFRT